MSTLQVMLILGLIFVALVVILLIARVGRPVRKAFGNMAKGGLALTAVNAVAMFTGVSIPVSVLSLVFATLLGIPGVIAMVLFDIIL